MGHKLCVLITVLFRICVTPAASNKSEDQVFEPSPENENSQKEIIAEDFAKCTETKRFQECIGSLQTSLIFGGAVIFVLTLCCTLICCKICFDVRERKRKRREDLVQATGYTIVSNFDTAQDHFEQEILGLQLNCEIQAILEDPDPPPLYPGGPEDSETADNGVIEDEPPPYSPSFKRGTVLDPECSNDK